MSSPARKSRLTPQEYLAIERAAETKSEFYDGQMYAMSGALLPHNRISVNLISQLANRVREEGCDVLGSDMRVAVADAYVYPDLVVVCGEPELQDDHLDTLLNPQVVVEILSRSTQKWDRGGKFALYQKIESLRHYVLVSQEAPSVECFDRRADGSWSTVATRPAWPDGALVLESLGVSVPMLDIYRNVFPADHPG